MEHLERFLVATRIRSKCSICHFPAGKVKVLRCRKRNRAGIFFDASESSLFRLENCNEGVLWISCRAQEIPGDRKEIRLHRPAGSSIGVQSHYIAPSMPLLCLFQPAPSTAPWTPFYPPCIPLLCLPCPQRSPGHLRGATLN